MEDYPRTLAELEARFPTDEECLQYLCDLRWPEGFVCPQCEHPEGWRNQRGLIQCAACSVQTSVTAGTIFHRTRKPLTTWFRAVWWVTSQKTGASALGLQQILGFGSYETAWTWLHKLRRAMIRPGRERLSGRVEVDETFWGAPEPGKPGRGAGKKSLVVIGVEESGRGMGRIRMRRIPDASGASLEAFVAEAVEPGSVVHTDGWDGYAGLGCKGYVHEVTILKKAGGQASELLPRVHRVAALLKNWLRGTHQGAISGDHLDYYLDEFTFRFNRRTSRYRGKLFYRLLQQAVVSDPAPYAKIIKGVRGRKSKKRKM